MFTLVVGNRNCSSGSMPGGTSIADAAYAAEMATIDFIDELRPAAETPPRSG